MGKEPSPMTPERQAKMNEILDKILELFPGCHFGALIVRDENLDFMLGGTTSDEHRPKSAMLLSLFVAATSSMQAADEAAVAKRDANLTTPVGLVAAALDRDGCPKA